MSQSRGEGGFWRKIIVKFVSVQGFSFMYETWKKVLNWALYETRLSAELSVGRLSSTEVGCVAKPL